MHIPVHWITHSGRVGSSIPESLDQLFRRALDQKSLISGISDPMPGTADPIAVMPRRHLRCVSYCVIVSPMSAHNGDLNYGEIYYA